METANIVGSKSRAVISISEEEYQEHCDAYDGVCLGCGEWTCGGCEPDARKYKCEACGEKRVYGCEEAMMMGRINISESEE
jgi:hypothetical protein